jgi:hypothetical protein
MRSLLTVYKKGRLFDMTSRVSRFVACLLGTAAIAAARAAPPEKAALEVASGSAVVAWLRTFASANDDWINDIVPLVDGSSLAVGFLNRVDGQGPSDWRALAVKLRDDGTIDWSKEYGAGGGIDAFWSVREQDDGGLLFGGFSSRIGPGGINAYFAATTADGTLLKENGYGTAGYDRITSLAPTPTGYLGVGHAEGLDGRDLFLIHVDKAGVESWRRVLAEPGANGALYVEPAPGGGFVVAGGTSPKGDAEILVLKVDDAGQEIWRRTIGQPGTDDINHGLAVLPDGRIVVAGYTQSWGAGGRDFLAAVLDRAGNLQSLETYGGAGDDHAILAKADGRGQVWIIGYTKSAGAGGWDVMLTQLDARGSLRDAVVLVGGPLDDNGAAVRPLDDGSVLIGGYSNNLGGGSQDAFVAKLGAVEWRLHPAFTVVKVK